LRLNLYNNEIKDQGLSYLADALSYASNIQDLYIDLAYNEFGKIGLKDLMRSIKKLEKI